MKIIKDNVCYVQLVDIINLVFISYKLTLLNIEPSYPLSIKSKYQSILENDNYSNDDFIAFTSDEEIQYFTNENNIVDYEKYLLLPIKTLKKLYSRILLERNNLYTNLNNVASCKDETIKSCIFARYDYMTYRLNEILKVIAFKNGNIFLDLPEQINYPKGYEKKRKKCLK